MAGGFAGTVYRAPVQLSATGELVAAVAGKKIRLLSAFLVGAGTVDVIFGSGAASPFTDLTGSLPMVANGQLLLQFNEYGWFDTAAGEPLSLRLSASEAVAGALTYTLV